MQSFLSVLVYIALGELLIIVPKDGAIKCNLLD